MILNLCSLAFNLNIDGGGATPAWGTEMGQGEGYKFAFEDMDDFFTGMVYNAVPNIEEVTCPLGKGGNQRSDYDFVIASVFKKVFVNHVKVDDARFLALIVKKINGDHHVGRRTLKYNPRMTYNGNLINQDCYNKMATTLGITTDAGWFVHEITINNQDEIHFTAIVIDGNKPKTYPSNIARKEHLVSLLPKGCGRTSLSQGTDFNSPQIVPSGYHPYLTAIRTKPFILLAGISGTGKSRIVRELAFKSCPAYLQDSDKTTPGNYCMIEVKPNWHDSTELLGYYSNLNKAYQFKKFVKFLIKAKMFPDVPFFVCLDEMNLAPVEQYFAEILSVLETRKKKTNEDSTTEIKTGIIIEPEHFKQLGGIKGINNFNRDFTDRQVYLKLHDIDTEDNIKEEVGARTDLISYGLTLPENVVIIGTVNMDDTTHQFSRKVIDRAMTIEMNGGRLKDMFGGSRDLEYLEGEEQQNWQRAFKQNYVTADEALAAHPDVADRLKELLPSRLEAINEALSGTPFEVSYRALNELTIMVGVMLDEDKGSELETIVNNALDRILLMKVLPRIEGDSDVFRLKTAVTVGGTRCTNRLEWLRELAPSVTREEGENESRQQTAKEKLDEMIERLNNQEFTRFWP